MYSENILKAGVRLNKLLTVRTASPKLNELKTSLCPARIFYLWGKHEIRRIEIFGME